MDPIDDHLLAGFLAGTLPPDQRARVVRYLAANADAREVLSLAGQALDAADVAPSRPAERPAARPAERAPVQRGTRRFAGSPLLRRTALAAFVVFGVGAGLRVAFGPPADQLRSRPGVAAEASGPFVVRVARGGAVSWAPVAGATHYEVTVWDPATAERLAKADVATPRAGDAFSRELRARLAPGHRYEVQVDALNAENRHLQASKLTPFTFVP